MPIATLINSEANFEVIRDAVAAILAAESVSQQALATAESLDPRLWALRVYRERSNPWSEFRDTPDQLDAAPIVNVALEGSTYDESASNTVERQTADTVLNIDCFGYGVAADDGATGHVAGDSKAALEAQRAVRLVSKILMAAEYTYLGLQGTVGRRWIRSTQLFLPQIENRSVAQVVAVRIRFEVRHNEASPQIAGEVIEELGVTFEDDGAVVIAAAEYRQSDWTTP